MKKTVFGGAIKIGDYNNPGNNHFGLNYQWSDDVATSDSRTSFVKKDIQELIIKNGVEGVDLIRRKMKVSGTGNTRIIESFWMCGIDSDRNKLDSDENYLAAPCPPYCGAGGVEK